MSILRKKPVKQGKLSKMLRKYWRRRRRRKKERVGSNIYQYQHRNSIFAKKLCAFLEKGCTRAVHTTYTCLQCYCTIDIQYLLNIFDTFCKQVMCLLKKVCTLHVRVCVHCYCKIQLPTIICTMLTGKLRFFQGTQNQLKWAKVKLLMAETLIN